MQNAIAYRYWINATILYVSNLPGDGAVDWGYSPSRTDAIELSPYWQRRFAADCRRCGGKAYMIDA